MTRVHAKILLDGRCIIRNEERQNCIWGTRRKSQWAHRLSRDRIYMIFYVKLSKNFRRKATYIAGGYTTRRTKRWCIARLCSEILSGDIQNAYLTAPNKEKVYCIAESEFGWDEENVIIITKALYGLQATGAIYQRNTVVMRAGK